MYVDHIPLIDHCYSQRWIKMNKKRAKFDAYLDNERGMHEPRTNKIFKRERKWILAEREEKETEREREKEIMVLRILILEDFLKK